MELGAIPEYAAVYVSGVPLMFVVIGLVWLWGRLGLRGRSQLVGSLVTGLVIGSAYVLTQAPPPEGGGWYAWFVYLFGVLIYGLAIGLLASGVYEQGKEIVIKSLVGAISKVSEPEEDPCGQADDLQARIDGSAREIPY